MVVATVKFIMVYLHVDPIMATASTVAQLEEEEKMRNVTDDEC